MLVTNAEYLAWLNADSAFAPRIAVVYVSEDTPIERAAGDDWLSAHRKDGIYWRIAACVLLEFEQGNGH